MPNASRIPRHAADAAVAVDSQRLSAQTVADADLPFARLERGHLLRDLAHRGEDQAPGQFRGGIRRRAGDAWLDDTITPCRVQAAISMCG